MNLSHKDVKEMFDIFELQSQKTSSKQKKYKFDEG